MDVTDEQLQNLGDLIGGFLDRNGCSGTDGNADDRVTLAANGSPLPMGTSLLSVSGRQLREAARVLSALPHVKGSAR